jgi:hypothetical protein
MNSRRNVILVVALALILGFVTVGVSSAQNGFPSSAPPDADSSIASGTPEGPPGSHVQEGQTSNLAPTAGAYSLRVAGATFRPRASDVSYTVGSDGGCIYATSGNLFTWWNLPLTLPQGTRISTVRFYFYDNDASGSQQEAFFTKYDLYGNIVKETGQTSTNTGYDWWDIVLSPVEVIDYNAYSYVLHWRPNHTGANSMLCGFRVMYDQPVAAVLPLIRR